ncbi:MAG: zf-HC2 domain-containing protein [Planctomycetota bacterium]|nr:zf-HC2 domain-containing protein [Planctomycetota bacterium]
MSEQQTTTASTELSCEQCRDLLSDYVDRELTEAERQAVERHLGTCNKCGSESTRMMGLKKLMQHWDGVRGSGEFRKSLIDKMVRESQEVPAMQFTDGAAEAEAAAEADPNAIVAQPERRLPPIWILLAAVAVAVVAYYVVLWLRSL